MDIDFDTLKIEHNEARHRFEIRHDGLMAVVEYRREAERIIFTHTEVPESWEGKGVASRLAATALDYAREEKLEVVALCPYIRRYLERHPEYGGR